MTWIKTFTFKDTIAASAFVKSLSLRRRYRWHETIVRIIVEEKSDFKDVDALAEHSGGKAEAEWEER